MKEAVLSWHVRECSVTDKGLVQRQGPAAEQLPQLRTSLEDPRYPNQPCPKWSLQRAPTVRNYMTKSSQDTNISQIKLFFPGNLKATCGEVQEALVILKGKSIPILIHIAQCIQEKLLRFAGTGIGSELFITEKETSNCEKLVW